MEWRRRICLCCGQENHIRGRWTEEEDERLLRYIDAHGVGNWRRVPLKAGIRRCGNSCRGRWFDYLCPDVQHGRFTREEDEEIIRLHRIYGDDYPSIAERLPGRATKVVRRHCQTVKIKSMLLNQATDEVSSTRQNQNNQELDLELKLCPPGTVNALDLNLELTEGPSSSSQ